MTKAVSEEVLEALRDRFDTASWALWSNEYPKPQSPESKVMNEENPMAFYQFILDNREKLNPDVILMGTRLSQEIEGDFYNFHSPNRSRHSDYHLRNAIQGANLENIIGAYMTDIFKEVIGPDEELPSLSPHDIRLLEEEFDLLDGSSFDVICLGKGDFTRLLEEYFGSLRRMDTSNDVRDILTIDEEIGDYDVHFYVVYSYALGQHVNMRPQLRYLNDVLAE